MCSLQLIERSKFEKSASGGQYLICIILLLLFSDKQSDQSFQRQKNVFKTQVSSVLSPLLGNREKEFQSHKALDAANGVLALNCFQRG